MLNEAPFHFIVPVRCITLGTAVLSVMRKEMSLPTRGS